MCRTKRLLHVAIFKNECRGIRGSVEIESQKLISHATASKNACRGFHGSATFGVTIPSRMPRLPGTHATASSLWEFFCTLNAAASIFHAPASSSHTAL